MELQPVATAGLVYYCSPRLRDADVPHAFSTRVGGISPPPFDSLNLGSTIIATAPTLGDDPANVRENYRRLLSAVGCEHRQWVYVHQVHGGTVAEARPSASFECGQFADAIISDDPGRMISVRTADCVPILLAEWRGRAVAAVHAGWRGAIAGVVPAAIGRMTERFGINPGDLVAAIGPSIGREAFEVGAEVLSAFSAAFGADAPIRHAGAGKGRVDLQRAVRRQLESAGVPAEAIDFSDLCTARDADEFFSHRRDAGRTGRLAALIGAGRNRE